MEQSADFIDSARIIEQALDLGFALAGVCDAEPTQHDGDLRDWIEQGKHGEMQYIASRLDVLLNPQRLLPGVRSIICVADRYAASERALFEPPAPRSGVIARYARGRDYHSVMRRRLHTLADALREAHPGHAFRACVDTAPLLEREYAARAGLGAVGKHTLLIEPGVGSYLLLGEILTTLPVARSRSKADIDPCESCTRCIDACPTQAITPWSIDATRCISYLTIEHRSITDSQFDQATGQWVFGCDICQEVCPHNQPTRRSAEAAVHEAYESDRDNFDLLEILGWDEAARRAAFAGSALRRAKLDMMLRNAVIAAGNMLAEREDDALAARLGQIASSRDAPPIVRETARRVLARLDSH